MIPLWKIKRELSRLKHQAAAIPLLICEPILQKKYDRNRAQNINVSDGLLPALENLVIFVIFQPEGVALSILHTCRHLVASGYSPLVVSNGSLSDRDRASLQKVSHLVAERPNFGYDFGGYRDGVWLIENRALSPNIILFLNDSVWFPVTDGSNFLDLISETSADYIGTQVFENESENSDVEIMFPSYCFAVKSPLLQHPVFTKFWSNYRLSSSKEVTLRRGERAFSRQMLDVALKPLGVYSLSRFFKSLDTLENEELLEVLNDMVALDPKHEAVRTSLLGASKGPAWNEEVKKLVKAVAKAKNHIGSSPVFSIKKMAFPMIKKNNQRLYTLARKQTLLAVDEGRLCTMNETILAEMRVHKH